MSVTASPAGPFSISGVVPSLTVKAEMKTPRTEIGIGALMPWADRLWMISYPSSKARSGHGMGLYEIRDDFSITKRPESLVGTHANRLVHPASDQLFIGCYAIDAAGHVRVIPELNEIRITATIAHLTDPDNKVYFLGMEGEFYECDVHSLAVTKLFNVNDKLGITYPQSEKRPEFPGEPQSHFKGGYCIGNRLVVSNNSFFQCDWNRTHFTGRLGEWDGNEWRVLDTGAYLDVAGRRNFGRSIFANGWDRRSAILRACIDGQWQVYRLPKASITWEHGWQTEWPRIREIETERYMLDVCGMFYELTPVPWGGRVFGVLPVCRHLRIIPDYCSWNGLLVMAGNQTTPIGDANAVVGQPQAGLWFGKSDDLWSWGKPSGWGAVWWKDLVKAGVPSDPFLMTGFEHKCLHLAIDEGPAAAFTVELDFLGDGSWRTYETVKLPAGGYKAIVLPDGLSAHWARVTSDADCVATASFVYT
ncbi:MAG: hypothetical protein BIFFINMI_02523 [Phycisphaerae bacterium]|nr:hypothetical protein [Phycisphaerae bacterium]